MQRRHWMWLVATLTIGGATLRWWPAALEAGDRRCARCGDGNNCSKVCRLVTEQKKITVTCWSKKEEEFCVPGRSQLALRHCEMVCDELDAKGELCAKPRKLVWNEWLPACDTKLFTKNKLLKKTVTKTVPSHKWVVEDLCEKCARDTEVVSASVSSP